MRLGPTLVGAILGAAVGIGLHVALEMGLLGRPIEAPWFAVVIGILTGLGVRWANKTDMHHASYARGAVTALIALGAIVGSIYAVGAALRMKDQADAKKRPAAAADQAAAADDAPAGDAAKDAAEPAPVAATAERPAGAVGAAGKMPNRGDLDPVQIVCMVIGAFVAYEFGRGTGARLPADASARVDEPVAMDPSN